LTVIRFRCPQCDKTLKVPDNKSGTTVLCPRCREACRIPAESAPSYVQEPGRPPVATPDQRRGLFAGMRGRLRWGAVLVVGVAVLSLFLAVSAPFLRVPQDVVAAARHDALILVPTCLVLFLVVIYAHVTSCPACGKSWARAEGATASLSRQVSDQGDVRRVRSLRQTTYVCQYCRHTWSATFTDEYQEAARGRRK
jgi:hypothetical protein